MGSMDEVWPAYQTKMEKEGCNEAGIAAFKYTLGVLVSGASVMIPESSLDPVASLPRLEELTTEADPSLLSKTVILKLNGGLGTGMGLEKAKSLLPVTGDNTFLDLIAKQVAWMKEEFKSDVAFMLMNSFATSADTLEAFSKYPDLGTGADLEFVQNKAPKVTAADLSPATWAADPSHEWCPPGHGDLYPAMKGSGTLDKLLEKGFKYMFVSNSDNLGATMDLKILTHFAASGAPFMMEVADRTEADKKGGHLARSKELFDKAGGAIPLPVIKNSKTVDPRDKASTKVLQLETAMGAAIECFPGATALVIPRTRFAPVKTTNDLFALRSDAYTLTSDCRIVLSESRKGVPPNIKLDGIYKFTDAMEKLIPEGPPSLIECEKLTVEGPMTFASGVVIKGTVTIKNSSDSPKPVAAGVYENTTVEV